MVRNATNCSCVRQEEFVIGLRSTRVAVDEARQDSADDERRRRRRRDSSSSDTRLDFKRIHYDVELFVLISWTQTPINYRWLPATPADFSSPPPPRPRRVPSLCLPLPAAPRSFDVCLSLTTRQSRYLVLTHRTRSN